MQLDELSPHTLRDPHGYSAKWHFYPEDVLPMWVADMDFPISPAITQPLWSACNTGWAIPSKGGWTAARAHRAAARPGTA